MAIHKKLMIPGPVDLWDETLDAMGEQVRSNFSSDWRPIHMVDPNVKTTNR